MSDDYLEELMKKARSLRDYSSTAYRASRFDSPYASLHIEQVNLLAAQCLVELDYARLAIMGGR